MSIKEIKNWISNNKKYSGVIILIIIVLITLIVLLATGYFSKEISANNTTILVNNTQPTINEKQNVINEINKEGGLLRNLEIYNNKLDKNKNITNLHIPNIENYDITDLKSLIELKNKLELQNESELNDGEKKYDKLFIVLIFYFKAEANENKIPKKNPISKFPKNVYSNDKITIINDINKLLKQREIDNNKINPTKQITNSNIPNIVDYTILELKCLLDLLNIMNLSDKSIYMEKNEIEMLSLVFMLILTMYFKIEFNINGNPIKNIFDIQPQQKNEPIIYYNEKKYPDGSSVRYWKTIDNYGLPTNYIETVNKDSSITYKSEKTYTSKKPYSGETPYTDKTIQISGTPHIDGTILYSWEIINSDGSVTQYSEKFNKIERSVDYTSDTLNKDGSFSSTSETLHY